VARADAAGPDPAVTALLEAAREQLGLLPNLDMGLAVLARRRGLPADAATALFALGRSAGWIAHAREAGRGELIRPRARYTGPGPGRG
jgi:citrate synthase